MATHSSILAWKNPMDGGAWQATVHGVSKSWTRRSDFTSLKGSELIQTHVSLSKSSLVWGLFPFSDSTTCRSESKVILSYPWLSPKLRIKEKCSCRGNITKEGLSYKIFEKKKEYLHKPFLTSVFVSFFSECFVILPCISLSVPGPQLVRDQNLILFHFGIFLAPPSLSCLSDYIYWPVSLLPFLSTP